MESPEFELCLHQTLSSFKPKLGTNGHRIYKRSERDDIYERYHKGNDGKIDVFDEGQFAIDFLLARNKKLVGSARFRNGVLAVGNECVQTAGKQITERLLLEKAEEMEAKKDEPEEIEL